MVPPTDSMRSKCMFRIIIFLRTNCFSIGFGCNSISHRVLLSSLQSRLLSTAVLNNGVAPGQTTIRYLPSSCSCLACSAILTWVEFNDIEECTAVSADMHRVFSHQFIQFGSTVLYNKYVLTPVNLPKLCCCPLSRLILGDVFLSSMTLLCSKPCYPKDPPPSP